LITAPLHLDSYVFTEVLPQLEELRNGLRQSVTSSSEMVDLQASQTEVVLTEWDLEPPPPVPSRWVRSSTSCGGGGSMLRPCGGLTEHPPEPRHKMPNHKLRQTGHAIDGTPALAYPPAGPAGELADYEAVGVSSQAATFLPPRPLCGTERG